VIAVLVVYGGILVDAEQVCDMEEPGVTQRVSRSFRGASELHLLAADGYGAVILRKAFVKPRLCRRKVPVQKQVRVFVKNYAVRVVGGEIKKNKIAILATLVKAGGTDGLAFP
jgi:hypothetical protein